MQKVILDLLPGGVAPIVYASQYDDGRSIRFMLTEGGPDSQYSLNGNETITAELTKPDGTETVIAVANPGAGKNYVDLVNGAEDYDQAGAYLGEIVLTRNARVIGSANFVLKVEEDAYGGQITTLTATGNPCTFTTDLADALVSLTADIVCGGGGGTPSTPIPIVGYSELNLTRCGVNFTDISDNTISGAGYVIGGFPVAINADNVVLSGGNYVFSFDVQNATYPCACQLIWYRNGVEVGNTVATINASGINSIAFTASGEFDSFVMFCNSSSGGAFTNFNLNIGSTATAYEPYNGQTFTVAFGQTVYGGVYDKSGRLTIEPINKIILTGTENWDVFQSGSNSTAFYISGFKNDVANTDEQYCSHFAYNQYAYQADAHENTFIQGTSGNLIIQVSNSLAPTVEDFKSWLATQYANNTPVEYRYNSTATPIVIDVSSISVFAEKGTNNIVSDCLGDVSVTYIKKV